MARIIGAVATSHTPTIGFALDKHKEDDPAWAPIFAGYRPVQQWLADRKPDVLLLNFNDQFFFYAFRRRARNLNSVKDGG